MEIYNQSDALDQLQRYLTAPEKVELVINTFRDSKRLLYVGIGPRYAATLSALAEEVHGLDIFPDSIDNCKKVLERWVYFSRFSPLKEELDILKSRELKPNFKNIKYALNKKKDSTIPYEDDFFDGIFAVELFLHFSHEQATKMLSEMQRSLMKRKKAIITCYFPSSEKGVKFALDDAYAELISKKGLSKSDFFNPIDSTINLEVILNALSKNEKGQNRRKYWLDLGETVRKIKLFSYNEVKLMCEQAGLDILSVKSIRGGMFPFVDRGVYILEKKVM